MAVVGPSACSISVIMFCLSGLRMRFAYAVMGCLFFCVGLAHADSSLASFCQSNVSANIQRARWGFELRQTMLEACADQNMRICSRPYTDQITEQERRDMADLQDRLVRFPVGDRERFLLEAATMQKTTAAYMALRGAADSPETVAQEIYDQCLTQEPRDLQAAINNGTAGQTVYPSCPGLSGMDVQYLQRCCTPDCYCDVYCQ